MYYRNKLHFIPYSELAIWKNRKSSFLMCFSDETDLINCQIVDLAKSRCKKYQMTECCCIDWKDYINIRRKIITNEKHCLILHDGDGKDHLCEKITKTEFNKFFGQLNKEFSTHKGKNFGIHKIRENRLGELFDNNTYVMENQYNPPLSDEDMQNSSPECNYTGHTSNSLIDEESSNNQQHQISTYPYKIYQPRSIKIVGFTNTIKNVQTPYQIPQVSSHHQESNPNFPHREFSMLHPQQNKSGMYHNPFLSQKEIQQYSQTFIHPSPQSSLHFYPQPTVTSLQLPRPTYISDLKHITSSSFHHPHHQSSQIRHSNQPQTQPLTHTTHKNSIDYILGSSSATSEMPKIFTHDEANSPFSRPGPSRTTQLRSVVPLLPLISPSRSLGSASNVPRNSLTQSSSTQSVLHQPWKDLTSSSTQSTTSTVTSTSSIRSHSHNRYTPYSRPVSHTGHQTSHTVTNRGRRTSNSPSRQQNFPGYVLNLSHRGNRNENNDNPSSHTQLQRPGTRTAPIQSNRSSSSNIPHYYYYPYPY